MFRGKDRQRHSFKDGPEHQKPARARCCREPHTNQNESSYQRGKSRSNHPPNFYCHRPSRFWTTRVGSGRYLVIATPRYECRDILQPQPTCLANLTNNTSRLRLSVRRLRYWLYCRVWGKRRKRTRTGKSAGVQKLV